MKKLVPLVLTVLGFISLSANANIDVDFREGAPKDRFVFTNSGECSYELLVVKIDLNESAGRLIFDTTERGDGVEVFQPFETNDESISLMGSSTVDDGQKSLSISISNFAPKASVSFTIDVDDTLVKSELGNIRVSRSEMQGAMVEVDTQGDTLFSGAFGETASVEISLPTC